MPPGFPRPKNIDYPHPHQLQQGPQGPQDSEGNPFKNGEFFGPIRNRQPRPGRGGRGNEPGAPGVSGGVPFGVAGYDISPFG
uniref:Uncharacterized protein n=1 Tax=Panagrolaimus superbus TaxID=310955 RepID=A0A914Y284_9BILA